MATSEITSINLNFTGNKKAVLDGTCFVCESHTVTEQMCDSNGHMNMAVYANLFDRALEEVFFHLHMDIASVERTKQSHFTIEVHISYLREISLGQTISIRYYLVDFSDKVSHFAAQMLHENGTVAADFEQLTMSVNMQARKAEKIHDEAMLAVEKLVDRNPPCPTGKVKIRRK